MAFDKIAYNNAFNKNTYDRIRLLMTADAKVKLKKYALEHNMSVNALILECVEQELKIDLKHTTTP